MVISGCQASDSRATRWASPQICDSAGLTKKPNSGGENSATSFSCLTAYGCNSTTCR